MTRDRHEQESEVLTKRINGEDFNVLDLAVVNEAIARNLDYTPGLVVWSAVHRDVVANLYSNGALEGLPIMEVPA